MESCPPGEDVWCWGNRCRRRSRRSRVSASCPPPRNSTATGWPPWSWRWRVVPLWDGVCVPLLAALTGQTAADIAVEHALSEGVRAGLDVFRRDPAVGLPADGVLLAGAEQEEHCLGLHALAAALRERRRGCLLLGPSLPWTVLAAAVGRVRPQAVAVWSQSLVTGRSYRLARFAREVPSVRVYGAGPGWVEPLTPPAMRLSSLAAAVAVM